MFVLYTFKGARKRLGVCWRPVRNTHSKDIATRKILLARSCQNRVGGPEGGALPTALFDQALLPDWEHNLVGLPGYSLYTPHAGGVICRPVCCMTKWSTHEASEEQPVWQLCAPLVNNTCHAVQNLAEWYCCVRQAYSVLSQSQGCFRAPQGTTPLLIPPCTERTTAVD